MQPQHQGQAPTCLRTELNGYPRSETDLGRFGEQEWLQLSVQHPHSQGRRRLTGRIQRLQRLHPGRENRGGQACRSSRQAPPAQQGPWRLIHLCVWKKSIRRPTYRLPNSQPASRPACQPACSQQQGLAL